MSFAATWMNLESVILSKISQTENEKYHKASIIYEIWKEMLQMNLQNRRILTDLENELIIVKGDDRGRDS